MRIRFIPIDYKALTNTTITIKNGSNDIVII
jgi:hypothetical protein